MTDPISKDELQALFCSRLKQARSNRRMTQSALAEASDLTVDMVSRIERGTSFPSFNALARLVEALEVDPAFLFGGPAHSSSVEINPKLRALHLRLEELEDDDLDRVTAAIDLIVR